MIAMMIFKYQSAAYEICDDLDNYNELIDDNDPRDWKAVEYISIVIWIVMVMEDLSSRNSMQRP